jgi:hypothetical protein
MVMKQLSAGGTDAAAGNGLLDRRALLAAGASLGCGAISGGPSCGAEGLRSNRG